MKEALGRKESNPELSPIRKNLKPILDSIPADGKVDRKSNITQLASQALVACIKDQSIPPNNDEKAFRLKEVFFIDKNDGMANYVYVLKPPADSTDKVGNVLVEYGKHDRQQGVRFINPFSDKSRDITAENYTFLSSSFDSSTSYGADKRRVEYMEKLRVVLSGIIEHGIHKDPKKFLPEGSLSPETPAVSSHELTSNLILPQISPSRIEQQNIKTKTPLTQEGSNSFEKPHYTAEITAPEMQTGTTTNQEDKILTPEQHNREKKYILAQIKEFIEAEDSRLGPLRSFPSLKNNINNLAGFTGEDGERVVGSLLTEPLDEGLLKTIGDLNPYVERALELKEMVSYARNFFTQSLIDPNRSSKKELLLPVPDFATLERGTEPKDEDYDDYSRGGEVGTFKAGETNIYGDIPLSTDGEFVDIQIKPTDQDIHIRKVKRFQKMDATPGDFADTNEESPTSLTDDHKLGIDENVDFRPTFELTLTEKTPYDTEETYKVWRVNDGILVQDRNSEIPTYFRRDMIERGYYRRYIEGSTRNLIEQ